MSGITACLGRRTRTNETKDDDKQHPNTTIPTPTTTMLRRTTKDDTGNGNDTDEGTNGGTWQGSIR